MIEIIVNNFINVVNLFILFPYQLNHTADVIKNELLNLHFDGDQTRTKQQHNSSNDGYFSFNGILKKKFEPPNDSTISKTWQLFSH
tara:strand:+ start:478 stop:735 length:258 start_codon:yes stop_codon:yes gene_type:complete